MLKDWSTDWQSWLAELPDIIPPLNNSVYVLFEDRKNHEPKYWLYESVLSELILVLYEINGLNDFYIISKKYDWLISIDHENVISYVGDKLKVNRGAVLA